MEPFTPHLSQEIWVTIGEKGLIAEAKWPDIKEWEISKEEKIILPIQVNGKRKAEKNNQFGKEFIELARNVYKFNDERAKLKLEINQILNSNIKEVKSHF